jgi:hypothetical protein
MMSRRRGWSDYTPDEKLEALRADVTTALDLIDELKETQKGLENALKRIAAEFSADLSDLKRQLRQLRA